METVITLSVPLVIAIIEFIKKYRENIDNNLIPILSIVVGSIIVLLLGSFLSLNSIEILTAVIITILSSNGLYDHLKPILPKLYDLFLKK